MVRVWLLWVCRARWRAVSGGTARAAGLSPTTKCGAGQTFHRPTLAGQLPILRDALKFFDERAGPPAKGLLDRFIRRFSSLSYAVATLALFVVAASALGIALVPSLLIVRLLAPPLLTDGHWWTWPVLGVLGGAALFLWGFALLIVVPVFNFVLPTRMQPTRGGYFSSASLPLYLHNGLFYLVRFTFLPFVTLTPPGVWFLRAMRMRMGLRPRISTEFLSDVCLISLGDDVTIGGSAHIFCHYGGAGNLVLAPVIIGSRVTVGEKATVMGDVQIGEGATILAHSVLLPGTRVGAGERWGGVPARPISHEEWDAYKVQVLGAER